MNEGILMPTKGKTMNTNDKNIYFAVKDRHGYDYFCPLEAVKDRSSISDQGLDECVEKDVVERYAGNIDINSP
jgi:hypothetical protein